jgi:hypothetical protein
MENYDKIINRIKNIPLSRNTVKERILELTNNVKKQLYLDLSSVKVFSISLDETTDITSKSRLAIMTRHSDGFKMREELVALENLPHKTTGFEICRVVDQAFVDNKIDIRKIVFITTDGAQNMVGKLTGFKKLFTDKIGHSVVPFHCIKHQEVLCAKSGFICLNEIMETVTKIVNFISVRPLVKREFSLLLSEVESSFNGLLMFNNVRWLSRGKVLERFVECIDEVRQFITSKNLENVSQLNDHVWLTKLMFFADISRHMNELNLKLQGSGKTIDVMFGYIKSFEAKIQIFKRDIESQKFKYFPQLYNYFEKSLKSCEEESIILFKNVIHSLASEFAERFDQFRSLEVTLKLLKYPDLIAFDSLNLSDFQWLGLENLEMQLVDFQNSV